MNPIDEIDVSDTLQLPTALPHINPAYKARIINRCKTPWKRISLWEDFIKPGLYCEDARSHVPVHVDKKEPYSHVSSRAVFGSVADDPSALQDQMVVLWKPEADGKTQIERLDQHLRTKHKDYRGYVAVWSGSKSVHFQLIFDPSHMSESAIRTIAQQKGKSPEAQLRDHWRGDIDQSVIWDYFRERWFALKEAMRTVAGIDFEFDESQAQLSQKRRLPWGAREITQEGHHGLKPGDIVTGRLGREAVEAVSQGSGRILSGGTGRQRSHAEAKSLKEPAGTHQP